MRDLAVGGYVRVLAVALLAASRCLLPLIVAVEPLWQEKQQTLNAGLCAAACTCQERAIMCLLHAGAGERTVVAQCQHSKRSATRRQQRHLSFTCCSSLHAVCL